MNRLLSCTALGLVLGLSPALAEPQLPADDTQTPPALEQPAQPSEVMPSEPSEPSDPAAPIPGDTSEAQPNPASPPSAEAPQSEPASPPSAEAPSTEPASPPSAEAPQPIEPAAPKSAEASGGAQFLTKQESGDVLASNLIGESVYNGQDEAIGGINDLVTDESGKVLAVLIGAGGFLGMGEKDVAIRFEDLRLVREEDNGIKVIADLNQDTLASAPDYETLAEQQVAVGSSKGDREDVGDQPSP
ncbi:MAG TPA: PRC-barrel domain-containing protein [Hyphomicrobiaceae bacterium]|nr:PRC-barrel domain-containing protein [Hyphomicrobiaceae bacterium]